MFGFIIYKYYILENLIKNNEGSNCYCKFVVIFGLNCYVIIKLGNSLEFF